MHYAIGGAKNWIDGQFPQTPDAFNRIVRGSSYWATEAGVISLTFGGAALKYINHGAGFLGRVAGKSSRTILQQTTKESSLADVLRNPLNTQSRNLKDIIDGFTYHGVSRVIDRSAKPKDILDALLSPLQTHAVRRDYLGRSSQRLIGKKVEVVINPQSRKIISVNPTSTRKRKSLESK